jgi:hypothetical protein
VSTETSEKKETVVDVANVEADEIPVADVIQEESAAQQGQSGAPVDVDAPTQEQAEPSKPIKSRPTRHHKSDGLFDGFDFDGENKE